MIIEYDLFSTLCNPLLAIPNYPALRLKKAPFPLHEAHCPNFISKATGGTELKSHTLICSTFLLFFQLFINRLGHVKTLNPLFPTNHALE
jgi:hypothetical protein